jgi:hypothetical protein
MPRYFFDLKVNGAPEDDKDGVVLADAQAARLEACRIASQLAAEPGGHSEKEVLVCARGEESAYFCEVELSIVIRDKS